MSSGDRDGGPSLSNGRQRQAARQVAKAPISAGRRWNGCSSDDLFGGKRFGARSGPAGKRRRKRWSSLLRDAVFCHSSEWRERSETQKRSSQEGPRNIGRFGFGRPGGTKQQRALGQRAGVETSGFSSERAVQCEATPELVSQDRGRKSLRADPKTNTGGSFARRSGGWQQCRPPFLLGQARAGGNAGLFLVRERAMRAR